MSTAINAKLQILNCLLNIEVPLEVKRKLARRPFGYLDAIAETRKQSFLSILSVRSLAI